MTSRNSATSPISGSVVISREVGLDWQYHVEVNEKLFRHAEVDALRADPSRARRELGWKSEVSFEELIQEMVQADLEELREDE